MTHLLAILGLAALCAGWVLFQQWLKRMDPEKEDYRPGCGACGSSGCKSEKSGCDS